MANAPEQGLDPALSAADALSSEEAASQPTDWGMFNAVQQAMQEDLAAWAIATGEHGRSNSITPAIYSEQEDLQQEQALQEELETVDDLSDLAEEQSGKGRDSLFMEYDATQGNNAILKGIRDAQIGQDLSQMGFGSSGITYGGDVSAKDLGEVAPSTAVGQEKEPQQISIG
jgi:hypothetical protein